MDFGSETALPWATQVAIEPGLSSALAGLAIALCGTGLWRRRVSMLVVATALAAAAIVSELAGAVGAQ